MYVMANGRLVEVPTNSQGQADAQSIRKAAGIDSKRLLVRQSETGGNEIVGANQSVNLQPGDVYRDMPQHKRGGAA